MGKMDEELVGIGCSVGWKVLSGERVLVVNGTKDNSPAALSGKLLPEDVIFAIDGQPVAGLSSPQIKMIMMGPVNSTITLDIRSQTQSGAHHFCTRVELLRSHDQATVTQALTTPHSASALSTAPPSAGISTERPAVDSNAPLESLPQGSIHATQVSIDYSENAKATASKFLKMNTCTGGEMRSNIQFIINAADGTCAGGSESGVWSNRAKGTVYFGRAASVVALSPSLHSQSARVHTKFLNP